MCAPLGIVSFCCYNFPAYRSVVRHWRHLIQNRYWRILFTALSLHLLQFPLTPSICCSIKIASNTIILG
nr:MAG TPA: hypothetical protein [Caudoviricetes sp.]